MRQTNNSDYTFDWTAFSCVGILGGTFNPIHNGHIMMAACAKTQYPCLERIVFLPNNLPAYKDKAAVIDAAHRLRMLALATQDMPYASVSDMELNRGGITYTIDTLKAIHKAKKALKIYFIIGTDSLLSFSKWYCYKEILKHCTLLVAGRANNPQQSEECIKTLTNNYKHGKIILLDNNEYPVSSSDIRREITGGNIPTDMLPKRVAAYIKKNKLYRLE